MARLRQGENWVFTRDTRLESGEHQIDGYDIEGFPGQVLIEECIDFYKEDEDGERRSVHLSPEFVRHFMTRNDDLPSRVAFSVAPLVMPTGRMLAPTGLDRLRGIQFVIPDDLRAIIPKRTDCTKEAVTQAMDFLCNNWLVDVATDTTGKCIIVADALTLIERSLLDQRPCFFYTAGRRGGGKTTTLRMLTMAVTGMYPAESAWSTVEEERRKALLAYFMMGKPYILWDNIKRGTAISCSHIEKSCTSAYYADRRLGVSELVSTSASTIHHFTGNNIKAKSDLASRSLEVRLSVDRADPENRKFEHPDPVGWTDDMRAELMLTFYILLLGNPQLQKPHDAQGKTRFKMWWRLIGSAIEHAAGLIGHEVDFEQLFLARDEDDEESASLADVLVILLKKWPGGFAAGELAAAVNITPPAEDEQTLREFLLPGVLPHRVFSPVSVGVLLKQHLDAPVLHGGRTLVLRAKKDTHTKTARYVAEDLTKPAAV